MPRNRYCYVTVDKIVNLSKEKFLYAVFDGILVLETLRSSIPCRTPRSGRTVRLRSERSHLVWRWRCALSSPTLSQLGRRRRHGVDALRCHRIGLAEGGSVATAAELRRCQTTAQRFQLPSWNPSLLDSGASEAMARRSEAACVISAVMAAHQS